MRELVDWIKTRTTHKAPHGIREAARKWDENPEASPDEIAAWEEIILSWFVYSGSALISKKRYQKAKDLLDER